MDTLPMIWTRSPFLRLLLPLMAGILLQLLFPAHRPLLSLFILLFLVAWLMLFLYWQRWRTPSWQTGRGVVLNAFLLLCGFLLTQWHRENRQEDWYGHQLRQYTHALVRLTAEPETKPRSIKLQAEVIKLFASDTQRSSRGEVLLYLKKSDSLTALHEGDYLLIQNTLRHIRPSGNPGSFDFAAYCRRQQVFHMAFLKRSQWRQLPLSRQTLSSRFTKFNQKIRHALTSCLPDSTTRGIAEALLIGYRENVDPEIWQAYSKTGIVHIIAISGMHMAMVYQSLRLLLLQIPAFRRKPRTAVLAALLFMWLFALLTGLPPSVSRAAFMFTLIGLGELSGRNIPVYNNLAGSAFLLLCINPFWIADVGFQLSYLAVLSLTVFYTPIYRKLYIPSRLPDVVWKLVAGTLAAQILTFPLCMYYFHQFPLVFVLTNIVAVPLSTAILYLELLLLFFRWIEPLALALGRLISWLIHFMNACIIHIGQWPYAVWKGLLLSPLQCMLLFALVIAIAIWLMRKRMEAFIGALSVCVFLLVSMVWRQGENLQQTRLLVYQIRGGQLTQFIRGQRFVNVGHYSDSLQQEHYVAEPARLYLGLQQADSTLLRSRSLPGFICYSFAGLRIVQCNTTAIQTTGRLDVDVLILGKGYQPGKRRILQFLHPKQIILDSSIPFWLSDSIQKELAMDFRAPVHVVGEQGAWIWSK